MRKNKKYRMRKWREDCWAIIFSFFGEDNTQRLQCKQEESTEEEEMKQQQRMVFMTKKRKLKGRTDAENRWWVFELAANCEKAWIHTGWGDTMQNCENWLEDMKTKDERETMEEMLQHKAAQMIKGAEERAGLFHNNSKLTAWRRGAQIVVNEEEDVRLLDRCEAQRKEWAKHWQCDEDVQNVEEKPWKNEELRSAEEARPHLKEWELKKVSRLYKAKTGHPKVPLDLTKEMRGETVEFFEKVGRVENGRNKLVLDSHKCNK